MTPAHTNESSDSDHEWKGVPKECESAWSEAFAYNRSQLRPGSVCPICGQDGLYRFFNVAAHRPRELNGRFYQEDGSLWEWCHACRHYEHMSSLVPIEWACDVEVDGHLRRHDPDYLDRFLTK